MKAASRKPHRRNLIIKNDDDDVGVTKTVLMITMQMKRKFTNKIETEPSDEEQINKFTSDDKQIQETNNTD